MSRCNCTVCAEKRWRRNLNSFRALVIAAVVVALLLIFCGCSIWPSSWRPFGTPVDREKKAAAKVEAARAEIDAAEQRAIHQTGIALDVAKTDAPDSKALAAARDFNAEAQALIDQRKGAPGVADIEAWHKLVVDVLAGRDKDREAQKAEVAALSAKLSKTEAAHARAETKLGDYAEENAALADWVRKLALGAICVVLFIFATHIVGLAAQLNPSSAMLGGAATALHSIFASGAVLAAKSAQSGLARVGAGIALVRQRLPAVAADVTACIDATTSSHPNAQRIIAAAATAAGAPPPAIFQ